VKRGALAAVAGQFTALVDQLGMRIERLPQSVEVAAVGGFEQRC
jgi:hypothetical protein